MKKKLCFAAVVTAVIFACCTNGDDILPNYDPFVNNVNQYGKHSTEVDLNIAGMKGFTGQTRSCDVNANMWPLIPEYPTDEEKTGVMAYIASNPGGVEWPGWTYFYVQHVDGANHLYSYTDWNGKPHSDINGTSHLDKLEILENRPLEDWEKQGMEQGWFDGPWTHVNNFNSGKCNNPASHDAALMNKGFLGARVHDTYGNTNVTAWKLFRYNGNYYLGFDYYMQKDDGKIDPDGIYDDWVVKIIPGAGEIVPVDPTDPVGPKDEPTDSTDTNTRVASVEFDIHHQQHSTWNELKTSIHLRDTVDVRVFIPIELQYQAMPDDFNIRTGEDYTYLKEDIREVITVPYQIAGNEYKVDVQVNHKNNGIEMLIAGADCAAALRDARGIYDDGITFEIHSYLYRSLTPEFVWNNVLKKVEVPETSIGRWPKDGSCVTLTYGQVHSAYYESEMIRLRKEPAK